MFGVPVFSIDKEEAIQMPREDGIPWSDIGQYQALSPLLLIHCNFSIPFEADNNYDNLMY